MAVTEVPRIPIANPERRWVTARRLVGWAVLVAIAVLLVVDNFVVVELRFLGASYAARLGWIMLGALSLGYALGRTHRRR